jgi:hypothetical protein
MAAVRERQKQRQTGSIVPQFSRDVEGCAVKNFHFALYKGGKDEGKEAACRKRTRIDYLARCAQTRDDLSISELLSFCHRSTKKRGAYSLSCEKSIATVSESNGADRHALPPALTLIFHATNSTSRPPVENKSPIEWRRGTNFNAYFLYNRLVKH